jgi:hypothetical protein
MPNVRKYLLIVVALLMASQIFSSCGRRDTEANMNPDSPRFPKLSVQLRKQLDAITPSIDGELKYYPCKVQLKDGKQVDRVYVVAAAPHIRYWGDWPSQNPEKPEIRLEDVVSLSESPSRLPPQFANKIYKAGESNMGGTFFTVVFKDEVAQTFVSGGAVDFIDYPKGKGPMDVADVLPHEGPLQNRKDAPDYYWCLFSE